MATHMASADRGVCKVSRKFGLSDLIQKLNTSAFKEQIFFMQ